MFLKTTDVGWELKLDNIFISPILLDEVFVSNTITILVSIGTIIFALIAILVGIFNYRMDREAEIIKNYLEETSNIYINYEKNLKNIIDNRYNIEIFLMRYNNLYEHFIEKNESLIRLGTIYLDLIYRACGCFLVAITFDIIYLYKILSWWFILMGIYIFVMLKSLWNNYIKTIFKTYLTPESYTIDFPSYEELLTPNKNISVADRKVVENLPAYLLRASSYIKIGEDIFGQEKQIKLYILKDFRMNATLQVEYEDDTSATYEFDSNKISYNEIDRYVYLFELAEDKGNISRITLEMPSDREGKKGTISFTFEGMSDETSFICTSFSESNSWIGSIPYHFVIKPRPKNE